MQLLQFYNANGFPWWLKNSPGNAGYVGLIAAPGKIPHVAEQLSWHAAITEADGPRACAPQQEKPR